MRDTRIEHLIHLVEKSDIAELEIQEGWGRRIRITRRLAAPAVLPAVPAPAAIPALVPAAAAAPAPEAPHPAAEDDAHLIKVASPMVGTFYRAASPESPPFVEVGSQVTAGQTLCIIEAMKLMNEIPAETGGSIRKILVENGQPVEFGQTLFLIEA